MKQYHQHNSLREIKIKIEESPKSNTFLSSRTLPERINDSFAELKGDISCTANRLPVLIKNNERSRKIINPEENKKDDSRTFNAWSDAIAFENSSLEKAETKELQEVLKSLKENKMADLNAKNKNGWTLLHFAASYGSLKLAEKLVRDGAQIDAQTNKGQTPLMIAAEGY
jgi:ankyrin repeat protein